MQHYTQFTAKGHYVPVNPLLIDISANSTTSQPHDGSLLPQMQRITIWRVKTEQATLCLLSGPFNGQSAASVQRGTLKHTNGGTLPGVCGDLFAFHVARVTGFILLV